MAPTNLAPIKTKESLFLYDSVYEGVYYPESDGMPMAESTAQYDHLTKIKGNAEILFADTPDVFIAGDLFWYPVQGNNKICVAPDVMLAFGRPKGHRPSYQQWREENVAPQVVFEILSPGNRKQEMADKFDFYDRYGVEEYYLYDPERGTLQGWTRTGGRLLEISEMVGWRSPRMGVRFAMDDKELHLYYPDGSRFLSMQEIQEKREEAEAHAHAEVLARLDAEEQARAAEEQAHIESQARSAAEMELTEAQAYIRQLEEALRQARAK